MLQGPRGGTSPGSPFDEMLPLVCCDAYCGDWEWC